MILLVPHATFMDDRSSGATSALAALMHNLQNLQALQCGSVLIPPTVMLLTLPVLARIVYLQPPKVPPQAPLQAPHRVQRLPRW